MRNLNGLKFLNGLKYVFVVTALSGTVNADINFDGQLVPAVDISSISILPASGDLNIITIPGYTLTRDGTPPPPGAVAISSFLATPATIIEGQSTSISWNTVNATSCTPTGGAGSWSTTAIGLPSGSAAFTIATAGTYTFTLTCDGAGGDTAVRNATVTVNTPPPPPVPGTCGTPTLSGTTMTWLEFWGAAFPAPAANRNDSVTRNGYKAYEFNTANIVDNGLLISVGNTISDGIVTGAVSECPGDFNVAPQCDHAWGIGGGITWATNGKAGACQLQPNTTYYFNITFTDGVDPGSSTCTTGSCIVTLQHVNR